MPKIPAKAPETVLDRIKQAWAATDDVYDKLAGEHVDPDRFQKIIEGKQRPTSTDLWLLSVAFQVPVDWLIYGKEPGYSGPVTGGGARDEEGKPLDVVGWYCWRCQDVNAQPCKSDSVPLYAPRQWAAQMRYEVEGKDETGPTPRFKIRERPASDVAIQRGHEGPQYSVWDTETGKKVPFGNYWDRDQALKRVAREEARN